MPAKTRPAPLHNACIAATRATSQILGGSPKAISSAIQHSDSTGRMAKIRLHIQQASKMRRKHGCTNRNSLRSRRRFQIIQMQWLFAKNDGGKFENHA
jgi:hypothetical protein